MSFFFHNQVEDGYVVPSSLPYAPRDVSHFLTGRSALYSGTVRADECQPEDDVSDDGCHVPGERKRRLGPDQVKALEKSFETGNKLEPERKMQLARALGLQPRQVAIWFQNRRARWKTKRLEKDYDALKRRFETLKNDNNALKSQNKKLHSQLMDLKNRGSEPPNNMINDEDNKNDVVLVSLQVDRGADNLIQGRRIDYTSEPLCDIFTGVEENNYQDFFGLGMDNIINFQ